MAAEDLRHSGGIRLPISFAAASEVASQDARMLAWRAGRNRRISAIVWSRAARAPGFIGRGSIEANPPLLRVIENDRIAARNHPGSISIRFVVP